MPLIAGVALLALDTAPAASRDSRFPLRVGHSRRYLDDATGTPFRVNGDTAWSLIAQLDAVDAARYLDDRAGRGFNAVIVNLLEHKFAANAPADRAGNRPFRVPGALRDPYPEYFARAHHIVEEAGRRGFAVWLCPAYLGWTGGDEGFFSEIAAAGPAGLREYGRFVGRHFKDLPNIVWVLGGDFAFPQSMRWLGDELAAGLREGGARQLMTAHGGQSSAVETFGDRRWLGVDTVYSYAADLRPALLAAYDRTPVRPYVLIEALYENEHDARPERIRRQAWTAMLSGAAGQFFGNHPIWHFDAPGRAPFAGGWRQALDSVGARDVTRLDRFFRTREWTSLEPDRRRTLRTASDDQPPIVAAANAARTLAIAYVPAGAANMRELWVNLRDYKRAMTARWFDPGGDAAPIDGGVLKAETDGQRIRTPASNRDGAGDWVLVLEAR